MIRIRIIHSGMFSLEIWSQVAEQLRASAIELRFCQQADFEKGCLCNMDLLLAELSTNEAHYDLILEQGKSVVHRLALSDVMPSDFTTFPASAVADFVGTVKLLSVTNFAAAVEMLCNEAGFSCPVREKVAVHSCGLCHPDTEKLFCCVDEYLNWRRQRKMSTEPRVALLLYYGQLLAGTVEDYFALVSAVEQYGFCPLPVFSAGIQDNMRPDWIDLLKECEGLIAIVNCMAGRLLRDETETDLLAGFDVPVFQALRSWSQTEKEWRDDPRGLPPMSATFASVYPEMFGVVRPTMLSCRRQEEGEARHRKRYTPLSERIDTLCRRLVAQQKLRQSANADKKLSIVLHNNPCKGVEATVGMAVGLDSFSSLAVLLKSLQNDGWNIGDAPLSGKELYDEIISRKAISEFRWTTVDEIIRKQGVLHLMGREEYLQWFDQQEQSARRKVEKDWGKFPGEGMILRQGTEEKLVITGVRFGNITILNQPKRGCYGPKCTGEVCRILHDPLLAPPHHWLATYYWIQKNSDAVLHFGTEGALEYLPGKQNGLSFGCFPEISIGCLPNFYLYIHDVVGEGLVAKRRGQAVLVDHLGPVFSPVTLDDELSELEKMLEQWNRMQASGNSGQLGLLEKELKPRLMTLFPDSGEKFPEKIELAGRRLAAIKRALAPVGLHVLGEVPDAGQQQLIAASMLRVNPNRNDSRYCARFQDDLAVKLAHTPEEITQLLHGLRGGYIRPGQGGNLMSGRLELLPTGRNFHGGDISRLPTRTAWQRGQELAEALLEKYRKEEGYYPKRVALSIWSTDAFKNDGELLCQILFLLGTEPCWDNRDKVTDVVPITLENLGRPRIDVTIETSSVMREMVPHFCDLMDRAVLAVSELAETDEENYVAMHYRQLLNELRQDTQRQLDKLSIRRLASCRVFSSATGTTGGGVALALDASAWTTEAELAEIHVNQHGHAWVDGRMINACDLFARQMGEVELAYIKQGSEQYDLLDTGYYATTLGGVAMTGKAMRGSRPRLLWHEAGVGGELCDIEEELWHSTAGRLLNVHWFTAMKKHGIRGAAAVSDRVNNLYKWSATTGKVAKELFDRVVEFYVENKENRCWLHEENPYALEEITRRLLEAAARDLWQADDNKLKILRDTALMIEGDMEESIGEVSGDFQGGGVEIVGMDKVEKWQHAWRLPDKGRE